MPKRSLKAKPKGKVTRAQKGKAKPMKPKRAILLEKSLSELDRLMPFRTCYVCERESRDLIMVGIGKLRHADCNPGSANWIEYIERIKKPSRTEEQNLLYAFHTQKRSTS